MSASKGSPRRGLKDEESGCSREGDKEDDDASLSPFDIATTKNASIERLKRWRQAALVLNASRRFRYTLDLEKKVGKEEIRKIRAHAQAIRAALLFKEAGERENVEGIYEGPRPTSTGSYEIGQEQLTSITRDHNFTALQNYGGVKGLSDLLKTNLEKGISGDDVDILNRRNAFGSNTYPLKEGRSFWRFLWEAWQDLTLIILMIAAVASLALGIKTEGIKEGWYDGGSITFAIFLVIIATGILTLEKQVKDSTHASDVRNLPEGTRISITLNDVGQPVGENYKKLVKFLGTIIRDGDLAPLTYESWKIFPRRHKEGLWKLVKEKFDIHQSGKKWTLKTLGKKWKDRKAWLKNKYFDADNVLGCVENLPDGVLGTQWEQLVLYWSSKEGKV